MCVTLDLLQPNTEANASQYPVITAHIPSSERWREQNPEILTTSANRNLLHPTKINRERRETEIRKKLSKGKGRSDSSNSHNGKSAPRAPTVNGALQEESSGSETVTADRDQLVDLMIEDTAAEETERVRARKEGGAAWNAQEPKHFV